MTLDTFVSRFHSHILEEHMIYEILKNEPDILIGAEVIATRAGFSCGSSGGTHMIVDTIDELNIHLKSTDPLSHTFWGCKVSKFPFSVKFADPELMMAKSLWLKDHASIKDLPLSSEIEYDATGQ